MPNNGELQVHSKGVIDLFPPTLPLQKGVPPFAGFGKEGLREILEEYVWSIMDSLISQEVSKVLKVWFINPFLLEKT
jgi:hypothetical protein